MESDREGESSSEYEKALSWVMWKESVALLRKRERVMSEKEKVLEDVLQEERKLMATEREKIKHLERQMDEVNIPSNS